MRDFIAVDAAYVAAQIEAMKVAHPELTEDAELLADTIEGETDFHLVMSRLVRMRQERRGEIDGLEGYINSLTARRDRMKLGIKSCTTMMRSIMDAAGQEKVMLPEATISITKARASVTVLDANSLPQGYFLTVRQPLIDAIGKDLKAGESIPGATLSFGEAGLTVRTK